MATTTADQPAEHDGCEDDQLPREVLLFTYPDLDWDEQKARNAGAAIHTILDSLLDGVDDLEDVERALRQADPASTRAHRAREQLLCALDTTNDLIDHVGNAADAFTFHWNTTTTPTSP
ncbi:MAG: hypothetical protein ACRDUV_06720 [Pseudonocardiaceae bacterium]